MFNGGYKDVHDMRGIIAQESSSILNTLAAQDLAIAKVYSISNGFRVLFVHTVCNYMHSSVNSTMDKYVYVDYQVVGILYEWFYLYSIAAICVRTIISMKPFETIYKYS